MVKILYSTEATATGGRVGHVATKDGALSVTLSMPKALGGGDEPGNNPEQLFAAGYAACYLSAIKNVARRQNIDLSPDSAVTAEVGVGPRDDGTGFGLSVAMRVHLPGIETTVAQSLIEAGHGVCPYSHALRAGLSVKTTLM